MSTQVKDRLVKVIIWACAIITILFLVLLLVYVISRGLPAINWEFLSTDYKPGLDLNGIAPIIGGSLLLIGLTPVSYTHLQKWRFSSARAMWTGT